MILLLINCLWHRIIASSNILFLKESRKQPEMCWIYFPESDDDSRSHSLSFALLFFYRISCCVWVSFYLSFLCCLFASRAHISNVEIVTLKLHYSVAKTIFSTLPFSERRRRPQQQTSCKLTPLSSSSWIKHNERLWIYMKIINFIQFV